MAMDSTAPNARATAEKSAGLMNIFRIVGFLATIMIAIFAAWEVAENTILTFNATADLTYFYLFLLAAWLMLRYRRRFENLLRQQSDESRRVRLFFENIVQDAGEAIVSFDRDGVIRTWNRAAETIYGYSAAEMTGGTIQRLLPPDLLAADEARRLTALVLEEGYVRDFETRRIRSDGTAIVVRITRSALRDSEGNVVGSTAIVRDVTGEKEMESRLIRAEKLAAIGQAASGIAHEVRNALAGISGAVNVLKDSAAWRELPEGFGEEFDLQVTRIAHIVNDLLSYARPGTFHTARANVHELLERALSNTTSTPDAAGKKVVLQLESEPIFARVDAGRVEQAFTNVATNAFQSMKDGGTLTVSTKRSNGALRIQFADSGCGMPEETISQAFDPFFTTKVRGTGLGLPIVRTIIEAHEGTVELASEPASGTTVTLTLPAEEVHQTHEDKAVKTNKTGVRIAVAAMVAILGLSGGLLLAEGSNYVGHTKCKTCHMSQHKSWLAGAHAGAFDKLEAKDQGNAECLACHTTGQGGEAAAGADLKGVQCEACHGPGSQYKSMKIMSKKAYKADPEAARKAAVEAGLLIPDEKTCVGCHNEKSPTFKGFDYAAMKEKTKHWD
jgi:PAS domain S-box-containing protein